MVARTAAQRRTRADIAAMKEGLSALASARTPKEEHAAGIAIHRAVTAATGNPQVIALSRDLLTTITFGIPIEPYSRDVFERALEEHAALTGAVVAGDVEEAGKVAQSHFVMTARTLRGVLERGLSSPDEPNVTVDGPAAQDPPSAGDRP